ncbi:DUF1272 domain-containing protein [Pokkaliibacter sp. CJK22405]|uniref:DUF1272 domain-containing protein n=1 Tax=Pokkaliibacter sp. CJK22405 TaxID=3384615 RepID=UPI003984CD56
MLELRPVCEHCAKTLPPDSLEARICSFECTFCSQCAEHLLANVCPNCGGGFTPRPIRPQVDRVGGNSLDQYPATTEVKHRPVNLSAHQQRVAKLGNIPPHRR